MGANLRCKEKYNKQPKKKKKIEDSRTKKQRSKMGRKKEYTNQI